MAPNKTKKTTSDNINSKLQLVIKSGKVVSSRLRPRLFDSVADSHFADYALLVSWPKICSQDYA